MTSDLGGMGIPSHAKGVPDREPPQPIIQDRARTANSEEHKLRRADRMRLPPFWGCLKFALFHTGARPAAYPLLGQHLGVRHRLSVGPRAALGPFGELCHRARSVSRWGGPQALPSAALSARVEPVPIVGTDRGNIYALYVAIHEDHVHHAVVPTDKRAGGARLSHPAVTYTRVGPDPAVTIGIGGEDGANEVLHIYLGHALRVPAVVSVAQPHTVPLPVLPCVCG